MSATPTSSQPPGGATTRFARSVGRLTKILGLKRRTQPPPSTPAPSTDAHEPTVHAEPDPQSSRLSRYSTFFKAQGSVDSFSTSATTDPAKRTMRRTGGGRHSMSLSHLSNADKRRAMEARMAALEGGSGDGSAAKQTGGGRRPVVNRRASVALRSQAIESIAGSSAASSDMKHVGGGRHPVTWRRSVIGDSKSHASLTTSDTKTRSSTAEPFPIQAIPEAPAVENKEETPAPAVVPTPAEPSSPPSDSATDDSPLDAEFQPPAPQRFSASSAASRRTIRPILPNLGTNPLVSASASASSPALSRIQFRDHSNQTTSWNRSMESLSTVAAGTPASGRRRGSVSMSSFAKSNPDAIIPIPPSRSNTQDLVFGSSPRAGEVRKRRNQTWCKPIRVDMNLNGESDGREDAAEDESGGAPYSTDSSNKSTSSVSTSYYDTIIADFALETSPTREVFPTQGVSPQAKGLDLRSSFVSRQPRGSFSKHAPAAAQI
jgi:hypothetical protein